jgi:hypothetical protein
MTAPSQPSLLTASPHLSRLLAHVDLGHAVGIIREAHFLSREFRKTLKNAQSAYLKLNDSCVTCLTHTLIRLDPILRLERLIGFLPARS